MDNIWDDDEDYEQQENNGSEQQVKNKADYESEDDKPKILKRKDEKLLDSVKEQAKRIKPAQENLYFDELYDAHDKLVKLYPQIENVFKGKEIPKLYAKSLYIISKSIDISDDVVKKIPKKNFLGKLKKALDNENEDIKNCIEDYVVDKESDDELDFDEKLSDDESDNGNEEDDDANEAKKKQEREQEYLNTDDPAVRRLKWLKAEYRADYQEKTQKTKGEATTTKKQRDPNAEEKIQKILDRINKQDIQEELSDEMINKEYNEKVLLVGQQNKFPEMAERLEYLVSCAKDNSLKLKLYILIINNYFDISQGSVQELSLSLWRRIHEYIGKINSLVTEVYKVCKEDQKNKQTSEKKEVSSKKDDDFLGFDNQTNQEEDSDNLVFSNPSLNLFQGSIVNFLERLQEELYKSLQFTEYSSQDYLERLKDEIKLITLCLDILNNEMVFNDEENTSNLKSKVSLVLVLSIYYKKQSLVEEICKNSLNKYSNFSSLIKSLFSDIYSKLENKLKIKTLLSEIYYYALNNEFNYAYNLFNKTNISELVALTKSDNLKMFYNRAIIQLGLCAFRKGEFELSKYFLSSICCFGTTRLRDNLCQTNEKYSTLEKEDKRKLIPYVMTIDIEEVETAFYLSLMIQDLEKVLINRLGLNQENLYLKKQIDAFEKQVS